MAYFQKYLWIIDYISHKNAWSNGVIAYLTLKYYSIYIIEQIGLI